jgi:hypothetical protein
MDFDVHCGSCAPAITAGQPLATRAGDPALPQHTVSNRLFRRPAALGFLVHLSDSAAKVTFQAVCLERCHSK